MNITLDLILRYIIIVGFLVGSGIWVHFCYVHKHKRNYGVAPLLFSFHALLYCLISAFNLLPKTVYLIWGDLVVLHGVIILISTGIVLIQLTEGGKK
jgi:hypothetical protein